MAHDNDDKRSAPWMRWLIILGATLAALALIWALFGLFNSDDARTTDVDTPAIEQNTGDGVVIESNTVETVVEDAPAP
jgi:DNA/RNA endonuclease YhcR with UshA esterase domain